MNRNLVKFLAVVCTIALFFSVGASARGGVRGHFSGSALATAVDSNGDGVNANDAEGIGKATRVGRFTSKVRSESLPWDGTSYCSSMEIQLITLAHATVLTTTRGDLIYAVIADSPVSDACFNVVDFTSLRGTTHLNIAGGTGRFSGASGYLTLTFSGNTIVNSSGLSLGSVFEGEVEGELNIAQ